MAPLLLRMSIIIRFHFVQVKDVMRQNIDKVNIRGEQIENLGETAGIYKLHH